MAGNPTWTVLTFKLNMSRKTIVCPAHAGDGGLPSFLLKQSRTATTKDSCPSTDAARDTVRQKSTRGSGKGVNCVVGHVRGDGHIGRHPKRNSPPSVVSVDRAVVVGGVLREQDDPVLSWLIEVSDRVQDVCVASIEMTGPEAVVVGWEALRRAMQEIGIRAREGLAEWIDSQGFPMPRWGAHFCSRAQERMLNIATAGMHVLADLNHCSSS